ncbi:protein ANTI-SILENCING 1 [Telopea speciosissima]|uniref:protein ANTI-SILENCING 1 n=1 Tax=Telopea speciosissima TaxID=54955 RepID=UPI001CC65067|nr:protein ANTI-SILENCING 1 [Telopea speciosissima]
MSRAEEAVNVEVCDFKWGKKRGRGGKKKEVQFYDSFTYDGVEYSLYDCVYLCPEDVTEPYIGKLIKIWEQPKNEKNKQPKIEKKVKVLWFFRPMEIQNFLGDVLPLEKELFLASGEGVGLANVNDLEAIAGKCNVVCINKDPRNPQPSEEELSMADYVFYRTFDVGKCTISHEIDDKVAGIEVMFIFNQKGENMRVLAINEAPQSSPSSPKPNLLDDRPAKKARLDMEAAVTNGRGSEDKIKPKPVRDSLGHEKVVRKKVKPDEKESGLSNGTLPKAAATLAREKDIKTDGQDRSKWFKGLPWEERMQTAHEQGTLVLLSNLYPGYASADVEEIIWQGFGEKCTAKMLQRTATSSPHSGQAFVIFKTREVAEMAMRKLDEGCLLLPNGRPLVASRVTPLMPGEPSTFYGHIFIEKLRHQMQREEMKRAVSTSHYSQPNTIEYDMAMEWRLLQARSESWWKGLYKRHGDELKKLRGQPKSK